MVSQADFPECEREDPNVSILSREANAMVQS